MNLESHHERCRTCPEANACTFYLDLAADAHFKALYLDNERYDGYFRDRCVFRPDIDIEDTMNVIVRYQTGATLSYSLNGFNAWEGYRIAFNGTNGRIEMRSSNRLQRPLARRLLAPGAARISCALRSFRCGARPGTSSRGAAKVLTVAATM